METSTVVSVVALIISTFTLGIMTTTKWLEIRAALARERSMLRLRAYEELWPAALAAATSGSGPIMNEGEGELAFRDHTVLGGVLTRHLWALPGPIANMTAELLSHFDPQGRVRETIQPGVPMVAAMMKILTMIRRDLATEGDLTRAERFISGSKKLTS
jgi:hypothetical protein